MRIAAMKKMITACLCGTLMAASMIAFAEETNPDVLVKTVADEVLQIVKRDKSIQAGDMKKIVALVDAKVLPNFDFLRMTRLAVGTNWRGATPEQRKTLASEFQRLLVHTYASVFTRYDNQTVEVKPLKIPAGAKEVTVKTFILKPGGKPVAVDYEMEKTADGWKVFDLIVEGVSLVTNYRGTFSDLAAKGGIAGLIKSLQEKNAANDTSDQAAH